MMGTSAMGSRPSATGAPKRPAWRDPLRGLVATAAIALAMIVVVHVRFYVSAALLLVDDAYFFARYARSFLDHGTLAWNVGAGATYASTSLLHQLVVVAAMKATGGNEVLSLQLASNGAFLPAIALLVAVAVSATDDAPSDAAATSRRAVAALTSTTVATSALFEIHARSGMDTMLALAVSAIAVLLAVKIERAPQDRLASTAWAWLPALVVAGHLARPDLDVLTIAPFIAIARAPRAAAVRRGLVLSALAIAVTLAVLRGLLGTALPLATYVKHGALWATDYGYARRLRFAGVRELATWIRAALPMLGPWIFAALPLPRATALRGAIAGSAVFCGYHAFLTVPIMGYQARYFVPAFPAVAILAGVGVARLASVWRRAEPVAAVADRRLRAATIAACAALVFANAIPMRDRLRIIVGGGRDAPASAYGRTASLAYLAQTLGYWPALSDLAATLDPRCSFAATEDGLAAALTSDRRFVDLSGLNDRRIALDGWTPARVLEADRPDVVYPPPGPYLAWFAELAASSFRDRYEVFEMQREGYALDVAVRRDSICYAPAVAAIRALPTLRRKYD